MSKIEKAVQYTESIAADNYHGYSQPRRVIAKTPEQALLIRDGDCSSTSLNGLVFAGFNIGSATNTGNSLGPLLAAGFIDVTTSINLETGEGLQRADLMFRPLTKEHGGHMAFCTGKDPVTGKYKIVQAQQDYDGKSGDSSDREISIKDYYDSPFKYVLRYPAEVVVLPTLAAPNVLTGHTLGEDVVYSTCYISSDSTKYIAKGGHGKITRIIAGSRNPYLIGDGVCWINDGDIRGPYVAPAAQTPTPAAPNGYLVKVTAGSLNIRSGPGTNYRDVGDVHAGDVYTITETSGGWGRLKSGAGWIFLTGYTERV